MSNFARVIHHIDMKDVKRKRLEEIAAKKLKEERDKKEKELIKEISRKYKSDWKTELSEKMTTGAVFTTTIAPVEGDGTVTPVDPIDAASFSDTTNMFGADGDNSALDGATIRTNGSGSGSTGGFDVGGNYLAFQGTGSGASRMALIKPIDATRLDTLTITAIRGTGSNGGEHPDIIGQEELFVIYKTPDMSRSSYLSQDRSQNNVGSFPDDAAIIAINQGDGTLQDYTIKIPEYARQKDTIFGLFQLGHSGNDYDHYGVTDIKFQRKTPLNVVVPLDDPQAVSFIRVGTDEGDPKKRKKKLNDQLAAADEYTQAQLGDEFPGAGTRVGGDDPFASAKIGDDVEPSPIGKDEVTKSFADFQQGQKKVEVLKTPEQIKAQNDEYLADLDNLVKQNDYDYSDPKIIEISDKILKTDPKNEQAYYYKVGYYSASGESEKALEVLDQLIKNDPKNSIGHLVRSYYKQELGDLAGAIEDIEKGIELDPDSPYVSYYEMDLADLKFQEAEVETNNAVRDRMESEAGAIEAKAHEDYWNNADLYEIEVPEIEPVEINNWDKNESRSGILDLYKADYETAKATIENLPKQSETIGATYNGDNIDYVHLSQINTNIESRDVRFRSPESMSQEELQRNLISLSLEIEDQKYWVNDLGKKLELNVIGAPGYVLGGTKFTGGINGTTAKELETEYDKLQDMIGANGNKPYGDWKAQNSKVNKLAHKRRADNEIKKLNAEQYQLVTQYNKLYDAFMGVEGEAPPEQPSTLYDQMKALYDEEDPEKEIRTELNELGFDKRYKDLMTAWDSADKFSKFITPLKNFSDALLGSKTAQNAKMENYAVAIAKSTMLNRPIRVDPNTIDESLKTKLASKLDPSMFLDYDLEQFYKEHPGPDGYMYPQGSGSGFGLIPIVSEAIPYADENIYEDEFGKVYTNDGSVENSTFQPFKEFQSWQTGLVEAITRGNPIAGRGQAQYQIVVPPDGSEPYLLYQDHAYHNYDSDDPGEVTIGLTRIAANFTKWLGNTAHNRSDGDANTGGMSGYPPNIRGDLITKFRINLTDLPEAVRDTIYRHPLLTENPGFVQALKDTAYNKEFEAINKEVNSLAGSKKAHELYTKILEKADIVKDLVVDNVVETIMGELPGKWNMTSASNMLQKYDEFIQGTVFAPDGRAYVPGVIEADGTVLKRIDVTDQFTKTQQNNLKNLMSDKSMEVMLKNYLDGKSTKSAFENTLTDHLRQTTRVGSGYYDPVLANSLGKGSTIDVDAFLNGKIRIKKGFEFRPIPTPKFDIKRGYKSYKEVAPHWLINAMAERIDVSNDASAAGNPLLSLATMTAARQLLRPVRGPANTIGGKQTFAQAMESAPQMPYKIEFDFPEKMLKILRGIEDKPDLRSGIAGLDEPLVIDKDKKNNVKESSLFERVKQKQFFNPKDIKPVFPENPPPQLDPKTGMHPEYGKTAKRYRKLDPISANAMPPTGDPETDAVVDKQRTKPKPKLFNKLKKHSRKGLTDK